MKRPPPDYDPEDCDDNYSRAEQDDRGSPGWNADIPAPQLNDNQLEVSIPFDAPRRFFRLQRP